jgi:hypothetical protein
MLPPHPSQDVPAWRERIITASMTREDRPPSSTGKMRRPPRIATGEPQITLRHTAGLVLTGWRQPGSSAGAAGRCGFPARTTGTVRGPGPSEPSTRGPPDLLGERRPASSGTPPRGAAGSRARRVDTRSHRRPPVLGGRSKATPWVPWSARSQSPVDRPPLRCPSTDAADESRAHLHSGHNASRSPEGAQDPRRLRFSGQASSTGSDSPPAPTL